MELRLPTPHAFVVNPTLQRDVAQQQAVDKRISIVAGGLSGLFSRPKPEEIDLAYAEFRYEAFWHVVATVRYVFERNKTYTVPVTGAEVRKVTVLGQEFEVVTPQPQQSQQSPAGFLQQIGQQIGIAGNVTRTFNLPAVEYCIDENRQERFLEVAAGQAVQNGADYVKKDKTELTNFATLSAEGALIATPQMTASKVLRTLLATMTKQLEADKVLEEGTTVETCDLYFRPVYAFELAWRPKNKTAVVEFDGVTGAMINGKVMRSGGAMLAPEALFDVNADNIASLFPSTVVNVQLVS
ncbi:hypothetical protein TFLX_02772 [Thermoflexales bacterium]|nr:hypothetical protein TFLX_02772 [Thermoflexales bacterium]